MFWFNIYGLIFVAVILIPNIVFAMKCKDGFVNKYQNRLVLALEQAGRFGCFGFMIFSIPGTAFGWWSDEAFAVYLIADIVLSAAYCAIWIVCFKKSSMFRAVALSVIPSVIVHCERDSDTLDSADCGGCGICTLPYYSILQKRRRGRQVTAEKYGKEKGTAERAAPFIIYHF